MANDQKGEQRGSGGGVEWRIRVSDGTFSEILVPETDQGCWERACFGLKYAITCLVMKVWRFFEKAWDLGVDDPRKVIHCLKVGVALTVVSLFYYMRPLYDGVGGNAMWAILTVVVVFENTVGATVSKSLNRVFGTFLAGFLAIGMHWIATKSGEKLEPAIIGSSVFILASAGTFSRFIPSVKARFDYGAMIFILTFSLVSISGFRVDKLFDLAHQRISTIIIGTSFCILISMLICPIWAGKELYSLITRNMDKLANSLDGFVAEFFDDNGGDEGSDEKPDKKLLGYKCILTSKTTEESLANFARWEPAHGRFNFRHPWKQYLKIGTSMRKIAYCIEALNGCISSKNKVPEYIKKHVNNSCVKLSSNTCYVIKELAVIVKTMRKSSETSVLIEEMNDAVRDLQNDLKSLPNLFKSRATPESSSPEEKKTEETNAMVAIIPLMEIIPVVTLTSLLIEIASRVQSIVDDVEELAELAEYKPPLKDGTKQCQIVTKSVQEEQRSEEIVKVLQRV